MVFGGKKRPLFELLGVWGCSDCCYCSRLTAFKSLSMTEELYNEINFSEREREREREGEREEKTIKSN